MSYVSVILLSTVAALAIGLLIVSEGLLGPPC